MKFSEVSFKVIIGILALAVIVGAVRLLSKLIGGLLGLATGVLNTVLGIVVILALVAIVIWMFAYASKKK